MKDIITIIIRLTVSCMLAATVIGVTFIFTSNAKKHNEHAKEQQVMLELLGYSGDVTVPDSISMHEIYRYIISILSNCTYDQETCQIHKNIPNDVIHSCCITGKIKC